MYKRHEKTIFDPADEMEKRRQKRMRRMLANTKRTKSEVNHKNKVQNKNYKVIVKEGIGKKK